MVLLLKRASTLLFIWLLALLFLYVIGSVQGFLEESMIALMNFMKMSSSFLVVLAFCGVLIDLFLWLYQRRVQWIGGMCTYLLLASFALFMSFFSSFVDLVSDGL